MASSELDRSKLLDQDRTDETPPRKPGRPFITCHVLDTVAGKPGANIHVSLSCLTAAEHPVFKQNGTRWTARTNADGRVTEWHPEPSDDGRLGLHLDSVLQDLKYMAAKALFDGERVVWSLTFQTEEYYGRGKTFWPEVELRFATELSEEHYHVPLLLGPWSYTTYRGS